MRTIRIDSQEGGTWLYNNGDWKDYCGVENFDETFVIHGNRDYHGIEEASWYEKAKELLGDLDQNEFEEVQRLYPEYTNEQFAKILDVYGKKYRDEDDLYVAILNIIFPEENFKTATIRGYSQSEWNDVLYKDGEGVDINQLEAFYFGQISEVYEEGDGCTAIETHDNLWKAQREGTLEKFVKDMLDIPSDEEIEIYESDGYIQTTRWKKVEV